ncbi:MAG TPA: peptidase dimerization domain-containing protein, partial [Clostridia bacterium]
LIKSKKGYCFDISQPIGTIISASPYYERFDITLHGVAAHASQPEEAIPVLQALQEILSISPLGRIDADTLFNIGVVEGGQVRNTVLGQLTLKGEIRSFVENKLTSVKEIFRNNISKIAQTHHLKIEEDWVRENPGYKHTSEESQKFITETQKIMKALTIPSQIIDAGGVSDANIFNDKGLLCINLGDGSEFTHTLKERIAIKDLTLLLQIIDKVIQV